MLNFKKIRQLLSKSEKQRSALLFDLIRLELEKEKSNLEIPSCL